MGRPCWEPLLLLLLLLLLLCSGAAAARDPTVLLLSFDGFRHDYLDKHPTVTRT